MAYPKLQTKDGLITITPELIREISEQVPEQIKQMTFLEMLKLYEAVNAILPQMKSLKVLRQFHAG